MSRLRRCGRTPTMGGNVAVKASGVAGGGRSAGYGGLQTCGSTWACPVCSAKIAQARKTELTDALRTATGRGWKVTHVVLTMRHHNRQTLAELWDALTYAWTRCRSGRGWVEAQARYGVQGWCRLVEATHGANGWHVHVHALLFTAGDADPAELGPLMFDRWRSALQARGLRAPLAAHGGLSVKVLAGTLDELGEYFTKNVYAPADDDELDHLAMEVARGDLKDARHGNRAPFRILADVVALGEVRDLELWHEWEQASRGRRQLTWSQGLRDDLCTTPELTDEQIAEQDEGGDVLLVLPRETWRAVCSERGTRALLLSLAEADDTGRALRAYLTARSWSWSESSSPEPL